MSMINTGNYVSQLEIALLDKWREKIPVEERAKMVLADMFDLIISLWEKKIITDSYLAMETLNFYYKYKKYRYFEDNPTIKDKAEGVLNHLLPLITSL